jgi:hypothetical protein
MTDKRLKTVEGAVSGAQPVVTHITNNDPNPPELIIPLEPERCSICGEVKPLHPISFDSVGEEYVDEEAGDMMCNECLLKEIKKRAPARYAEQMKQVREVDPKRYKELNK